VVSCGLGIVVGCKATSWYLVFASSAFHVVGIWLGCVVMVFGLRLMMFVSVTGCQ